MESLTVIFANIFECVRGWCGREYVCVCVRAFQHNCGTPGAVSTKLNTHVT